MSVLGLGASLGITSMHGHEVTWLHTHESQILVFGAVMLFVTGIAQYLSWRIDCRAAYCSHGPCAPRKRWSRKVYVVASLLYIANLIAFLQH